MQTGDTVKHYEIGGTIGAGGMGEVYRAIDTRLQRSVAIKLLSTELATATARQRFQREAQTASMLNHPHIVTVHDVGEHGDRQYLVMELVSGGTLDDWLGRERRSWRQIVELLVGVADGLAAAHAAGILHRDVKPTNVLVSDSGHAKVGDFGLAKLTETSEAPTVATPSLVEPTRPGVVMGTIAYMSPEQAEGRPLDERSDIFSFGIVLYEAFAGRVPFTGATGLECLQNIVHTQPEPLGDHVPAAVRFVVEKALEKEPADRYQSMREVVVDLRRALRTTSERSLAHGQDPPERVAAPRPWVLLPLLVVCAACLGAGATWLWIGRSGGAEARPAIELHRLSESIGLEEQPALSPDGDTIAYVASVNGRRQIFGRLLDEGGPFRITDADADHAFPHWVTRSRLVYWIEPDTDQPTGSLWERDIFGSTPPQYVGPAEGEAAVSHSGETLATLRNETGEAELVLIDRAGGPERTIVLTTPAVYSTPRWSPDDRQIAVEARRHFTTAEIHVIDVESGESQLVLSTSRLRGMAWLPDGAGLVYASSEGSTLPYPPTFSLWSVKLDGTGKVRLPIVSAGHASFVEPDVARNGTVVANQVRMSSDVYRYPVDGTPRENTRNGERITRQTGQVQVPSISPSGEEVAYLSDSGGHSNVWVARVDGSEAPRQITFEQDPTTIIAIPRWSPVGDRIVYLRVPRNPDTFQVAEQWVVDSRGRHPELLVTAGIGAAWSHDGEWLYYTRLDGMTTPNPCTEKVHIDGGEPQRVRCGAIGVQVTSDASRTFFTPSEFRFHEVWTASPVDTGTPELLREFPQSRLPLWPHQYDLSPDDAWLATPLIDRGTTNLWLISTEDGSLRQVTDFGDRATLIGRQVSWSAEGKHVVAAVVDLDSDIVLLKGVLP